MEIKYSVRVVV